MSPEDKKLSKEERSVRKTNANLLNAMYGLWRTFYLAGGMQGIWLLLTGDANIVAADMLTYLSGQPATARH